MIKKKEQKNIFHTSEVIFLIIITCVVSIIMGIAISSKLFPGNNSTTNDELLQQIADNYHYIKENYYEDIEDETLINGAIAGMIDSLDDPYSIFIEGEESDDFNMSLNGNYQGVGIEITNDQDGNIVLVSVFEDSPAAKAGLQAGDIVKSVLKKEFLNTDKSELTSYIKSLSVEQFDMVILRNGQEVKVTLVRDTVVIPSVDSQIFERNGKKVGYIYFYIFSNTTYSQFEKHLRQLENDGIDSLIIDVRENSGGHLTTAANIMSLFLDSSKIIYQTETKEKKTKYYSTGNETKKYPIVVLQNQNSASASELLSAALKESYGATIIGETSYGKGTVQELISLDDNNEYKFTTKKWLTPNGNWIHKKGVVPDIEVVLDDLYYENPNDDTDNQLQEAINHLTK